MTMLDRILKPNVLPSFFAQGAPADMSVLDRILKPNVLPFMVAIVAIIVGGVVAVTRLLIRHRERIAMIEQGMHPENPDAGAGDDEKPSDPEQR